MEGIMEEDVGCEAGQWVTLGHSLSLSLDHKLVVKLKEGVGEPGITL